MKYNITISDNELSLLERAVFNQWSKYERQVQEGKATGIDYLWRDCYSNLHTLLAMIEEGIVGERIEG